MSHRNENRHPLPHPGAVPDAHPRPAGAVARWCTLLLGLATALALAGCSSWPFSSGSRAVPSSEAMSDASESYVIGVPDQLQLTVWQHPDFSGPLLVRRDGKVSVPLMGDVQAAGRTPVELAENIRLGLGQFISNPRVDVAVTEMRSQVVSVIGEGVLNSGVVEIQRQMRVIDAIAAMGGFSPFARKDQIRILRNSRDRQIEYRFDYEAFVKGRNPDSNILLEPGDTIIVQE